MRLLLLKMLVVMVTALAVLPFTGYSQAVDTVAVSPLESTVEAPAKPELYVPRVRKVPDSIVNAMKLRKQFRYANDPAYWKEDPPPKETSFNWYERLITSQWFKYLVISLMAALVLFAIVRIALSSKMLLFKRTRKSSRVEEDELLQQQDLSRAIDEAEANQQHRLAIRYRYMKALQQMDAKQLISLNAQSTNWDYVNRMSAHPLKKQFLLLTRAYEYVWYGEFEVTPEQYQYLKTEFLQYENSLG